MTEKAKGRRGFLKSMAAAAAGTAAALVPVEAALPEPISEPKKQAKGRLVHYVGPTRHCIEAMLVEEHVGGQALVQYQQRPPTAGTTYFQASLTDGGKVDRREGERPVIGSWHEAATCPCGRPYSEFYYGRKRKKPEEPILAEDWVNTGYGQSLAPMPVIRIDGDHLAAGGLDE